MTNVIDSEPALECGCTIQDAFCPVIRHGSGLDAAAPVIGVFDCVVITAEAIDSLLVKLLYNIVKVTITPWADATCCGECGGATRLVICVNWFARALGKVDRQISNTTANKSDILPETENM